MAVVTVHSDFGVQENKVCLYIPYVFIFHMSLSSISIVSLSICSEVMGPDVLILVFRVLGFKLASSLSSFTFKRQFSSSLHSAIRVISSEYLRLLIFLLTILIPACDSFNLAFHMMYPAYN